MRQHSTKKKLVFCSVVVAVFACALGVSACVPQQEDADQEKAQASTGSWLDAEDVEGAVQGIKAESDAHQPDIHTLADGTRVQLSPTGWDEHHYKITDMSDMNYNYNTTWFNSDERGCLSCHQEGLQDALDQLSMQHYDVTNGLGIELSSEDCRPCHDWDGYQFPYNSFGSLIHGIHSGDSFKGNCFSCHDATSDGKGMVMFDNVKHTNMMGITKLTSDEFRADTTYDQATLTGLVPVAWGDGHEFGSVDDPLTKSKNGVAEDEGTFNDWEITVSGLVQGATSIKLSDLVNDPSVPKEKHIHAAQCLFNSQGGGMVQNVEITGIPLKYIFEKYGVSVDSSATALRFTGYHYQKDSVVSDFDTDQLYLVYELNGKRLSWYDGYPCMIVNLNTGSTAGFTKWISEIEAIDTPVDELEIYPTGFPNDEGIVQGVANAGIMNFREGQIIPAGQPYTFEGYALSMDMSQTVEVDFSLDNGETWQKLDTSDSDPQAWVHWNFTYTPEQPGSYVLTVRSVNADGVSSPYPRQIMFNAE